MLLGACNPMVYDRPMLACGHERNTGFGGSREAPAVKEKNGFVGLMSSWANDTGQGGETYELLQCQSGVSVRIMTHLGVFFDQEIRPGYNTEQTVAEFVDSQRSTWDLSELRSIANIGDDAESENFDVDYRRKYSDAERATCACRRFYPRIERSWPDKTESQLEAERQMMDAVDEFIAGLIGDE